MSRAQFVFLRLLVGAYILYLEAISVKVQLINAHQDTISTPVRDKKVP